MKKIIAFLIFAVLIAVPVQNAFASHAVGVGGCTEEVYISAIYTIRGGATDLNASYKLVWDDQVSKEAGQWVLSNPAFEATENAKKDLVDKCFEDLETLNKLYDPDLMESIKLAGYDIESSTLGNSCTQKEYDLAIYPFRGNTESLNSSYKLIWGDQISEEAGQWVLSNPAFEAAEDAKKILVERCGQSSLILDKRYDPAVIESLKLAGYEIPEFGSVAMLVLIGGVIGSIYFVRTKFRSES